jgi:Protein of unknown function (DUF1553)/Protein of unknown function (DUF1549)/Planctomycete cytochrome C
MKRFGSSKLLIICGLVILAGLYYFFSTSRSKIDFNAQVKPILNKHCIACHGGVRQKADYSLLFRSEALAPAKSGKIAIIPGNANGSELIKRITSSDADERMPYKHDPLPQKEIDILKQWINEGANWGNHWAYVSLAPVEVPDAVEQGWTRNSIDNFVLQKLKDSGLQHAPIAGNEILLRRTSLDLIGLPAPGNVSASFLNDKTGKGYETLIDSLLANKHFGEKWTSMWLDLARYADTKGYEHDADRKIWRYRDWLINAFNNDMPYNEFLTQQLAGDLMPGTDDDKLIATAFHRNSMCNDEGGTDPEEFRTAAVIDRVNTTWEALMGTTFACVQCHTHPYDPFKHDEYYKFMAFFNNARDENTEFDYPLLRHYSDSANEKMEELMNWLKINADAESATEIKWFLKTWQPAINSVIFDQFEHSELGDGRRVVMRNNAVCRVKNVDLTNKNHLIYRYDAFVNKGIFSIHIDKPDGPLLTTARLDTGKKVLEFTSQDFTSPQGVHDLYFTYTTSTPAKEKDEDCALFEWFYFTKKFPGEGKPGYAAMKKRYWDLMQLTPPTTPIMLENPSQMFRTTNVFERGNWLVKGPVVTPDVPKSLNPFPNAAPKNRLGLAMWLTAKENPLTARTVVNRVWEQLFGMGLAETLEDMGTQGIQPVHKELLDWLSWRFMNENNWSLKKLVKDIMMSATYMQQSNVTEALLEKDPSNKLYARGPRVRLSAEQIRDQSLAVSGLLSPKMFGEPVMPWQPKGIWLSPWNYSDWITSKGEDRYRRAIYTFWKRTAAYPSMLSFDGVAREVCTARRIKTNTPLQALVTLNDSVYIEAANYFAIQLLKENSTAGIDAVIKTAYTKAMQHDADEKTFAALKKLFEKALVNYTKNAAEKEKLLALNDNKSPEAAALMLVVNAIFNLDEFVTKN